MSSCFSADSRGWCQSDLGVRYYLLFTRGEWVNGLILAAFGAIVIGQIDNLLRPFWWVSIHKD